MGTLLALAAMIAALMFAIWPMIQHKKQATEASAELNELLSQRELALADLRELDFDRDLGNLSDEDHQELREHSKRHAVAILKQLHAEEHRIDEEIEQAVAALRGSAPSQP